MNDDLRKFKKLSQKFRLSGAENARVKQFLINHISMADVAFDRFIPSPYSFMSLLRSGKTVAAVVAFLVLISAGTSYAAEQALPGETLYSIKVGVNEEVQNFVAFGTDAKAELALEHAKNRLQEAEELSVQGKLNPETQQIIVTNFNKHADELKAQTKVLATSNNIAAAGLSNELQTSVKAHAQILKAVAGDNPQQVAAVNSLVRQVETQVGTSTAASSTENAASSTVDIKAKMTEADSQISEAKDFVASSKLPESVLAKVSLSLQAADSFFKNGQDIVASSTEVQASSTLNAAFATSTASSSTAISTSSASVASSSKILQKQIAKNSKGKGVASISSFRDFQNAAFSAFAQAETKAAEARVLTELYLNSNINGEQAISLIPNSVLNASTTNSMPPTTIKNASSTQSSPTATSTATSTVRTGSPSLSITTLSTSSLISTSTASTTATQDTKTASASISLSLDSKK